jgi:hypothetical protein
VSGGGYGDTRGRPDEPPLSMTSDKPRTEAIGGHDAVIESFHYGRLHSIMAQFAVPTAWILAQANNDADSELEMVVIRSVRFPLK